MATPSVQERLQELGYALVSPDRRSSEHSRNLSKAKSQRWAAVIKTVGISPEWARQNPTSETSLRKPRNGAR